MLRFRKRILSAEILFDQFFQSTVLGSFCCIGLNKMIMFCFQCLIKSENKIGSNQINDACRCHAVHLVPDDMRIRSLSFGYSFFYFEKIYGRTQRIQRDGIFVIPVLTVLTK